MSISETVFSIVGVETVASSGTSVSSSAFPDGAEVARLVASAPCFVKFGATAVTAASTTGVYMPAESAEYFKITKGNKLAVIQDSAAGTLRVAYLARG